jgi:hypothetical protein
MSRKTVKETPMNVVGVELRAVRLELSPEVHRELRIEAAKADMSMSALVRELVENYLAKKTKENR